MTQQAVHSALIHGVSSGYMGSSRPPMDEDTWSLVLLRKDDLDCLSRLTFDTDWNSSSTCDPDQSKCKYVTSMMIPKQFLIDDLGTKEFHHTCRALVVWQRSVQYRYLALYMYANPPMHSFEMTPIVWIWVVKLACTTSNASCSDSSAVILVWTSTVRARWARPLPVR